MMNDKDFKKLAESVDQMGAIMHGDSIPHRRTTNNMMNREIKFRAWHNNAKRYMEDLCLYLDSGELGDVSECFHNLESREDYILEQYTGLKDKNGKEIYEGDIIQMIYDTGRRGEIEEIEWLNGIDFDFAGWGTKTILTSQWKYSEVIGNIHKGIFKDKSTTNE